MQKPEKGDRHLSSRATTHKLLQRIVPETGESMNEILARLLHAKGAAGTPRRDESEYRDKQATG